MELQEITSNRRHYFLDEKSRIQGVFTSFHDNGQVKELCFYVDDRRQGEYKRWHPNGILWAQYYYVDGINHGEYRLWYYSGQPAVHSFTLYGKTHGEHKLWERGGALEQHDIFIDGHPLLLNMSVLTPKDKFLLNLKYGDFQWLP